MGSKGPKLKIQPFDLQGERLTLGKRWERWLERFERDLSYNGIDPEHNDNSSVCQMALLIYSGESVEDLHDTLAEVRKPDGVTDTNWTEYKQSKGKLNDRFLPKRSNDFALCELMTLKPTSDESMMDFAGRLRRSAAKCDFASWSADKMIKCLVISHMTNEELRLSCLEKELRLDQVLDKVKLKEDSAAMSKIMRVTGGQGAKEKDAGISVNKIRVQQRGQYKKKDLEKRESSSSNGEKKKEPEGTEPTAKCTQCGWRQHPAGERCYAANRKCSQCGKMGHYARVCGLNKHDKAKKVQWVEEELMESDTDSDSIFTVFCVDNSKVHAIRGGKTPKGTVIIKMNGINVKTMIDTGSGVNIIDSQTHKRLGEPKVHKTNRMLFPFGTRNELKVKGVFKIEIESQNTIAVAEIFLVEGPRVCSILSESLLLELGLIKYVHQATASPNCPS